MPYCLIWLGLGKKAGKRLKEPSGGQQQRVAVALALANDPSLILADEPTGNLDIGNTETITSSFLSLAEKWKTVIMASHDPKAVERFQKVYSMRDGTFCVRRQFAFSKKWSPKLDQAFSQVLRRGAQNNSM